MFIQLQDDVAPIDELGFFGQHPCDDSGSLGGDGHEISRYIGVIRLDPKTRRRPPMGSIGQAGEAKHEDDDQQPSITL